MNNLETAREIVEKCVVGGWFVVLGAVHLVKFTKGHALDGYRLWGWMGMGMRAAGGEVKTDSTVRGESEAQPKGEREGVRYVTVKHLFEQEGKELAAHQQWKVRLSERCTDMDERVFEGSLRELAREERMVKRVRVEREVAMRGKPGEGKEGKERKVRFEETEETLQGQSGVWKGMEVGARAAAEEEEAGEARQKELGCRISDGKPAEVRSAGEGKQWQQGHRGQEKVKAEVGLEDRVKEKGRPQVCWEILEAEARKRVAGELSGFEWY